MTVERRLVNENACPLIGTTPERRTSAGEFGDDRPGDAGLGLRHQAVQFGLPGAWLALLAPANTNKAVIDKLYAAMAEAVNDPKVRTLFVEQGAEPLVLDPEELRDFMASESAKWAAIIGKIGIEPM